ncbi:hypothetical protein [Streptomyces sp. 2231.1]|uniref:hypothetical protein n=1 Tax=Streptomyces sp. 2231.1 TaxID=1855347 RepID=UPI00210D6161|nr:hypothetical protein [Streptomyces sp. 2231.1]
MTSSPSATILAQSVAGAAATLLTPASTGHPWTGWTFSAGWGSRQLLDVTLVNPDLVVEVGAMSPAMRAAGGGIPPASTGPGPISCPVMSHVGQDRRTDDEPGKLENPPLSGRR